jgi:hypothetical protein
MHSCQSLTKSERSDVIGYDAHLDLQSELETKELEAKCAIYGIAHSLYARATETQTGLLEQTVLSKT